MTDTQKDTWLTPDSIVEAVSVMLDGIYLDPCAEVVRPGQSPNVPSVYRFTIEDDGLARDWMPCGGGVPLGQRTVFINPPYSRRGNPGKWIEKALAEVQANRVGKVLFLLPAKTETRWIRPLENYPRLFIRGRVKFKAGGGQMNYGCGMFPSMFVGIGVSLDRMLAHLGHLGPLYVRVWDGT